MGHDNNNDDDHDGVSKVAREEEQDEEEGGEGGGGQQQQQQQTEIIKVRKVHKLSLKKTEDFNAKLRKRGVIYVARIPPKMTPTKIKQLMSDFGEVTRVYLAEEDASVRKRRRKLTGNGCKRYVEGWVEFAHKSVAKQVAMSLNNTPVSNHKRNPHCDDLWNLKYLHRFQWSYLTEKVAYERRMREQKLRFETLQARKETAAYKHLVETGKKVDKIEERKRKRALKQGLLPVDDSTKHREDVMSATKKIMKTVPPQVQPLEDGTEKPTKHALLGSLL
jgi:ESF2/ABP1 family protein